MMAFLRALRNNTSGTMAIEMAFVTPVMVLLSLGAFEASNLIARQQLLQSGATEAAEIALAKVPKTADQRETLRQIIMASLDPAPKTVTVSNLFRCGLNDTYEELQSDCASGDEVSTFLRIAITDTYVPQWTSFGIGEPVDFNVVRMVQIS